jgi:hypothetical protein
MKSFNTIICEAARMTPTTVAAPEKLGHLDHIEDRLFQAGDEGYQHAVNTLNGMHNHLAGNQSHVKIGEKFDGAPSLVFGRNPENGKFFVATKSWGNKNPKINYTPEDIERNHGHAPGLVEKLNAALEHLPKVTPRKGVYQGDVMYTNKDVNREGKDFSFTPNTLTYTTGKDSPEGKKIAHAKIGVAVHTGYEDGGSGTLAGHRPRFMPNLARFGTHPDVHIISTEMKPNPKHYTDEQKAEFQKHMDAAQQAYSTLHPDAHQVSQRHADDVMAYLNHEVRRSGTPSHAEFQKFVSDRGNKEIGKLKSQSNIDRKTGILQSRLSDIAANKEHFDKLFQIHKHLQDAKNVLVNASNQNNTYRHSIAGNPAGPEGSVVVDPEKNTIDKAVNRSEFSAANFAKNAGSGFVAPEKDK